MQATFVLTRAVLKPLAPFEDLCWGFSSCCYALSEDKRTCGCAARSCQKPDVLSVKLLSAPLGLEIVERQLEAARRSGLISKFPTLLVAISRVPAGMKRRCRVIDFQHNASGRAYMAFWRGQYVSRASCGGLSVSLCPSSTPQRYQPVALFLLHHEPHGLPRLGARFVVAQASTAQVLVKGGVCTGVAEKHACSVESAFRSTWLKIVLNLVSTTVCTLQTTSGKIHHLRGRCYLPARGRTFPCRRRGARGAGTPARTPPRSPACRASWRFASRRFEPRTWPMANRG